MVDTLASIARKVGVITGVLWREGAVETLIQVLKDENANVRIYAARVLGDIADKKAIEPLTQIWMKSDEDFDVREGAENALAKIMKIVPKFCTRELLTKRLMERSYLKKE